MEYQVLAIYVILFLFCCSYHIVPNLFRSKQNMRGGRVKLHSILNPPSEFDNAEKGDALYGEF